MNTQKTPGHDILTEDFTPSYVTPILDKMQFIDHPSDGDSDDQTSSLQSEIISNEDLQAQVIGTPQNVVKIEKPIFIVENLEANDEGGGNMWNQPELGNFLLGEELKIHKMHSNGNNSRA